MATRLPLLAVCRLVLLFLCAGHSSSAQESLAFVDVTVVPMDSARAVPHQTVVVGDGRVTAVGPSASTPVPPGALVVDGSGRYLMPGLADMHVHLTHPEAGGYYHESNRASFGLLLAHGVTTVRNMWGSPGLLSLRDSAGAGLVLAPRLTTTGPFVEDRSADTPGPWSPSELDSDPLILHVRTEADGRAVARYHDESGYDYVKVRDRIPAAAYRGLTDEATRLGLPVVGHAPWAVGLGSVLTQGRQSSVEHVAPFAGLAERSDSPARPAEAWYDRVWGAYAHDDPERMGLLAELTAASRVWVTPTLFVSEWYGGPQPDMLARLQDPDVVRYTSAAQRESWREYAEGFATNYARWGLDMGAERAFSLRMVQALDSTGARLLLGTDATPAFGVQGMTVHEELALMVEAGLTPSAALRTATVNAQTYLREAGFGTSSGTVRVGEPADLVLLDENPLDDVGHARQIRGVVTRGRWLGRTALDGLLADAEARYRDPSLSPPPSYGARTPRSNPDAPSTAYVGGQWWDGARFAARDTVWAVEGVFAEVRPRGRVARTVELGGRWVVPPYGDAHTHMLADSYSARVHTETFEREGVFYALVLTDRHSWAAGVMDRYAGPGSVDVAYAHGGWTSPRTHPVHVYEAQARNYLGRPMTDAMRREVHQGRTAEDDAYFEAPTLADVEAKWDTFLSHDPDLVKVYLLDVAGEYPALGGMTGLASGRGLTPQVLREVVRRSDAAGLRVFAHVQTAADVRLALEAGVDGFAHLPGHRDGEREFETSYLDDATVQAAGERGVVFTPTTVYSDNYNAGRPARQAMARDVHRRALRRLHAAGARVALGADQWGRTSRWEADFFVRHRYFDPATVLDLWTRTTSQAVFPGRAIGALEDGFEASLLALRCDPTRDWSCTAQIAHREKQGVDLDADNAIAETAAAWRALEVGRFTAPPAATDDPLLAGLKAATRGDLEDASALLRAALEAAPDSLQPFVRSVAADVAEERFAWAEAVALRVVDDPAASTSVASGYARLPAPSLALEGETSVPFDGLRAPVEVNGVEVQAVVDTGAPGTGIPRGLVERLGLRVDTTARGVSRVPAMGLEFEVFAVLIDSVRVGDAMFYNVPATVGWTEDGAGDEDEIFLGANVLRLADALRYDYAAGTFGLSAAVPGLEGDPNFLIDGGSAPVVPVTVGGQAANAIVDTGNQRTVYLARGAFDLGDAPVSRSISGDGWSVDLLEVAFEAAGHAPFTAEAYEADFLFRAGNPIEVVLGRTVWEGGALTVDVRNRRVQFEPDARVLEVDTLEAGPVEVGSSRADLEPVAFVLEDGTVVPVEQGEVRVLENRSEPGSREIAVRFVRLPSRSSTPGAPVVYLAGGPGGSGTDAGKGERWAMFDRLRDDADVILLDQRGTGLSDELPYCESSVELPPDQALSRERVVALHRAGLDECLAFWKNAGVDVRGYTTWESAADVEAVRQAIGAERVSLLGISYGTHLALATLRRFPDRVDRLVLVSTEGPDDTAKLPSRTDAYLDRLQTAIDADSAGARYPDVRGLIERVLARVEADPPRVTVRRRDGTSFERTLGPFDLQQTTGWMVSDPDRVASVLEAYRVADRGDVTFFSYFPSRSVGFAAMPTAMDLASGVSPERRARIALEAETATLGDALNFPMPHLDGAVDGLRLPDAFREPVVSDRPALLFSGTLDGRTYPEAAAEVAAGFANGAVVTVENAGHNLFFSHPDVVELIADFLAGAPAETRTLTAPVPTFRAR